MYTGFAIALAWPETPCKQAGAWYDSIMTKLGISKNNYYKVGHAAVILIDKNSGKCFYFDFGRYHSPAGFGRVRDQETDHDLKISTSAKISDSGMIINYEEIVQEVYFNLSCHGKGQLHSSYIKINFERAIQNAKYMQKKSPWKYGPFIWNGTNCSRFVRTIILTGNPPLFTFIKLLLPISVTPTPIGNVLSMKNRAVSNHKINYQSEVNISNEKCQSILN